MDSLLGKELHMGDKIQLYSDIYREVEGAHSLYSNLDEILEEEGEYKSDLMSLKTSGLHRITAKLEVFLCKHLFIMTMNFS